MKDLFQQIENGEYKRMTELIWKKVTQTFFVDDTGDDNMKHYKWLKLKLTKVDEELLKEMNKEKIKEYTNFYNEFQEKYYNTLNYCCIINYREGQVFIIRYL